MKTGGSCSKSDRDLWKENKVGKGGLQVSMQQWSQPSKKDAVYAGAVDS